MVESMSGALRSIVERLTGSAGPRLHAAGGPPQAPEFLERLLRNVPGMAYRRRNDADWTMEFVSPGCRELLGFEPRDLVDNAVVSYESLIHPDDSARVRQAVRHGTLVGGTFEVTYRIRRADGEERQVWEHGTVVWDEQGGVEALEGFVADVTDREVLARSLLDNENRVRALVEQSLAGVYVVQDGRFQYVNPRFARLFGYSVEEILALPSVSELVHPEDREIVKNNLNRRLDGSIEDLRYDFRGLRKDGSVRYVEVHGRRIELDDEPAVMGTILDVTERWLGERRYHERQKALALGRLAVGVAQDLDRFLAQIKTAAEELLAGSAGNEELRAGLAEIVRAVDQGSDLSSQLMRFGAGPAASSGRCSLSSTVDELTPVLGHLLGPGIELCVDVAPDLPEIAIEAAQVEEIVMDLAANSRDAMDGSGRLDVRCYRVARGPEQSLPEYWRMPHLVIEVSDEGRGIEPEVRREMFEPYFTTKGEEGTGLGLANVWRIVSHMEGHIDVESELGQGTTFRVFLPIEPLTT